MDERMLNIVQQIRAVAMASGVTPEQFQKFFTDEEAQDQFYIKLHVAEDNYKAKMQEEAARAQNSPDALKEFAVPTDADKKETI